MLIIKSIFSGLIDIFAKYWRIILPLAILALVCWYIHALQAQRDEAKENLASYITQQAILVAKQEAKNAFELQARENITNLVVAKHTLNSNKLRKHYAQNLNSKFINLPNSLHQPASNDSATLPAESEATDGISEDSDRTSEADTFNLELAGEEVLQCQALIEWESKQATIE